MRIVTALALALLAFAPVARADTAIFLSSDPRSVELASALDLELRGYGVLIALRPGPEAFTSDARAASALTAARAVDAEAALWLEPGESPRVRAVRTASGAVEEAPLPTAPSEIDARTFAAVAGSVVLEAIGRESEGGEPALPATTPPEPAAAAALVHNPLTREYRPTSQRASRRRGLFASAGPSFGFVLLRERRGEPDRSPTSAAIDEAAQVARREDGSVDAALARHLLRRRGFDCQADDAGSGMLRFSNCTVAVAAAGYAMNYAIQGAIGFHYDRLSVAATFRTALSAGEGPLARLLLGMEFGALLTRLRSDGAFAELVGGIGAGQIQGRPAGGPGPYVRSGLGELRGGVRFGYRFPRFVGFYGAVVVHGLFPYPVAVLDPSFGIEVRP